MLVTFSPMVVDDDDDDVDGASSLASSCVWEGMVV